MSKPPANPYLQRSEKRGTAGHGKPSEKRVLLSLAARMQPASGALPGAKGDGKKVTATHKFRIECKSTTRDTLPLELAWLTKITHEALTGGEVPMVTISFVTPEGKPRTKTNTEWALIPMEVLKELIG